MSTNYDDDSMKVVTVQHRKTWLDHLKENKTLLLILLALAALALWYFFFRKPKTTGTKYEIDSTKIGEGTRRLNVTKIPGNYHGSRLDDY